LAHYAQVAERRPQDGTCSSAGYTVEGATNAKYHPAIGDLVAMLYTKPTEGFQAACSLHEASGGICGQSDLGCQHAPNVKAAERGLQEGLRSSIGYTVKGATAAKHRPVIDVIAVTPYTKSVEVV